MFFLELIVIAIGIFMVIWPEKWWKIKARINSWSAASKNPSKSYLQATRISGIFCIAAGIILAVMYLLK